MTCIKEWEICFPIEKAFSTELGRCQVTEHCYHPSLNAQHPYKDYSLLLAVPDISRIYISGGTINLWTVQVTNVEYIVLRATFRRQRLHFDALHIPFSFSLSLFLFLSFFLFLPWKFLESYNYNRERERDVFPDFYTCMSSLEKLVLRNSVRRQRILNCRYMHTNNSHNNGYRRRRYDSFFFISNSENKNCKIFCTHTHTKFEFYIECDSNFMNIPVIYTWF